MKKFILTVSASLAASLVLAACSPAANAPDITIDQASMRLPAPGQTTSAAYFTVQNAGGPDVLVSAATPAGNPVELHTHLHEDGIMKMRKVETIPVPTGQTELKPGGLHIMIFNTDIQPDAKEIPLSLTFEKSGVLTIAVPTAMPMPDMKTHDMKNQDMKSMDHSGH